MARVRCANSYCSHACGVNTSHLVPALPSEAELAASPGGFCPLAVTFTRPPSRLPPEAAPRTFCCTGLPSTTSTRLESATGWEDSNELAKSPGPASAAEAAVTPGTRVPNSTAAASAAAAGERRAGGAPPGLANVRGADMAALRQERLGEGTAMVRRCSNGNVIWVTCHVNDVMYHFDLVREDASGLAGGAHAAGHPGQRATAASAAARRAPAR